MEYSRSRTHLFPFDMKGAVVVATNPFEAQGFADELLAYVYGFLGGPGHYALMLTCKRMARVGGDAIIQGKLAMRLGLTLTARTRLELWWSVPTNSGLPSVRACVLLAKKRDVFWRRHIEQQYPTALRVVDKVEQRGYDRLYPGNQSFQVNHCLATKDPYYLDMATPDERKPWALAALKMGAWWALDRMAPGFHCDEKFPKAQWKVELICRKGLDDHLASTGGDKVVWPASWTETLMRRKRYATLAKHRDNWQPSIDRKMPLVAHGPHMIALATQYILMKRYFYHGEWQQFIKFVPDRVEDIMAMPRVMQPMSAVAAIHVLDKTSRLTQDRYDALMGALISYTRRIGLVNDGIALGSKHGFVLGPKSAEALAYTGLSTLVFRKVLARHVDPGLYPIILDKGFGRTMIVSNVGKLVSEDVLRETFAKYQDYNKRHKERRIDKAYRDILPSLFDE